MTANRGADLLARSLKAAGVKRIFTLSGNHIMPVFDAALTAGIELLHVRHEAAAVHMADAYARLTGEPGIAMVTGGPGHANAVGALYTAQMSESPVVLLSGHAPNNQAGMGAFQEMRQAEMTLPVVKAAWTSASADSVGEDVARAIASALSGRPGPTHLSLPTDALEDTASAAPPAAAAFAPHPLPLSSGDAQSVMQRLRRAHRPLVLAGPAMLTRNGRARLAQLEEASGIPVVGMESPRGVSDPSLGAFAQMLASADCVLLLGKRLDFTLKFGQAPAFDSICEFLQIDAEAAEFQRSRNALGARLGACITADAVSALSSLTQAAQAGTIPAGTWRNDVNAAIRYRPPAWDSAKSNEAGKLHPVQACRPLQALLDAHPDAVLISDGGEFGQWAQACLSAPNRVINGPAGAIGSALPFALGARVALPEAPIVALMGDGTFGFHTTEMDTAVRYKLPFVAVIGNDARWNAEYQIQLKAYGPERLVGCELLPTRYDLVAAAFGAYGEQVNAAEALPAAAARAQASRLPALLNVAIEGVPAPMVKR
ncbi:MAG TPA: thiamine pyrophosphate-binding protein [Burkholderiales bacterium]|nr:thiamine pyrophosphate-binding protein [Burkholderiales bacterium]